MKRLLYLSATLAALAAPAHARDSLGIFGDWGAFRDPDERRCYAIAMPTKPSSLREFEPFATIGTWPDEGVRGQFHIRLSRSASAAGSIRLVVGNTRFELTGASGNGWAEDRQMDAAIIAALRSASKMTVSARDTNGRNFTDEYSLQGAATAMDAATVGCARL